MRTQTFKLFTVLAFMLSMSCSVDTFQEDYESEILQRQMSTEQNSKTPLNAKSKADDNIQQKKGPGNEIEVINEIPAGTDTKIIYLDMAALEVDFNNSEFATELSLPFREFYRNLMVQNFTIYTIEQSSSCVGIEKWVVNTAEYDFYIYILDTTDETVFENDNNSTGGGNTSNAGPGLGGVNGGKPAGSSATSDDDDDEEEEDEDDADLAPKGGNYAGCF